MLFFAKNKPDVNVDQKTEERLTLALLWSYF